MPEALFFFEKPPDQIHVELAGFPARAVDAAFRFREGRDFADLDEAVKAGIGIYLPRGSRFAMQTITGDTRLREDMGMDSLTLTEMLFKFDELLGVPIEMREAAHIQTVSQLQEFLRAKVRDSQEWKGAAA